MLIPDFDPDFSKISINSASFCSTLASQFEDSDSSMDHCAAEIEKKLQEKIQIHYSMYSKNEVPLEIFVGKPKKYRFDN